MEIVLALAAIVGISLTTVPRLRRRSRRRVRANAGKQWATTAAARRHRRPAAARTRGAQGTRRAAAAGGSGAATAVATETYDEWDDDLDWGGETAVAAAPPAAPAAPLPESNLDWRMPGEPNGGAVAEPAEEPMWDDWADAEEPGNGNGNGVVALPVNGEGAAPPVDDAPPAPVDTPERATRHPDAPEPAPLTEPEWDWEPVVSRTADTCLLYTSPSPRD